MFVEDIVRRALEEDIGRGDITSNAVIKEDVDTEGYIASKEEGILAGTGVLKTVFKILDSSVQIELLLSDGDRMSEGSAIAKINGNARSVLAGERVALNFLQRLSGIATATSKAVREAMPYGCIITDTRKTVPGIRLLEKKAVLAGGGKNHRLGLDDAVLIKDNHIKAAGGVRAAISLAKKHAGHLTKIEIEAENLVQVNEALEEGVDVIMLDNMSLQDMKKAVTRINGKAIVEASGKIKPGDVARVASAGVDVISLGWITHSAAPVDISLELEEEVKK